jgi:MoxR-like ATPase
MNTKKIAGIELPIVDLEALSQTWGLEEPERLRVLEQSKALVPNIGKFVTDERDAEELARKVALATKLSQQIILKWPKGTGKTTTIYYVAQETGNPLVPIQLNGSTQVDTLIGKWLVNKEGTYWIDGLFTMAWKYGRWIILDELNMALPEIMAILHPALDSRGILVLDEKNGEIIQKHPNTRIFAAINPSEDYAGTKEMNAALEDRFAGFALCDYPREKKERDIILVNKKVAIDDDPLKKFKAKEGTITKMVKCANEIRKLRRENKVVFEVSTRGLIDWACWCVEIPIKEAFKFAVLSKVGDADEMKTIMDVVDKHFSNDEKWSEANKGRWEKEDATVDEFEVGEAEFESADGF